tara:strand:- start:47 stop:1096 length:1050 start_codon:yes stop_codon:yes gene_type:complete
MAYTTIDNPELYFQTKTYTGNGSTQSITFDGSEDMQPDFLWVKGRSVSEGHYIQDSVRGVTKHLHTQNTDAEVTDTGVVTALNSDGFSLGDEGDVNSNSGTFVAWGWKAGTSFSNDASATSVGSIDSAGSVSTTAGFSIVSYTGTGSAATIKHGLNTKPDVIICKSRSGAEEWRPYFSVLGATKAMRLNGNNAEDTDAGYWNNTEPTSSVFTVGTNGGTNGSSVTTVAYCFHSVQGYSKFGKYTGNGNADGPYIYLGFKPAWFLIKKSSANEDWELFDNKRLGYNVDNNNVVPNSSSAEATTDRLDIVSNGIKFRASSGSVNSSGATYIYMAFAESPFTNSNGIPNNAR